MAVFSSLFLVESDSNDNDAIISGSLIGVKKMGQIDIGEEGFYSKRPVFREKWIQR